MKLGWISPRRSKKQPSLAKQGDLARDAGRIHEAARLYATYLEDHPQEGPIHVQCGHMHKESGDFERAEHHYVQAEKLMPGDADLAFQMGHFYKIVGRLSQAQAHYRRAEQLAPTWPAPRIEIAEMSKRMGGLDLERDRDPRRAILRRVEAKDLDAAIADVAESREYYRLEGFDQRVVDPQISRSTILMGLQLCIDAGNAAMFVRACRQLSGTASPADLPLALVVAGLEMVAADRDQASRLSQHMLPIDAQNAMLNAGLGIISRQRQLIDQLHALLNAKA